MNSNNTNFNTTNFNPLNPLNSSNANLSPKNSFSNFSLFPVNGERESVEGAVVSHLKDSSTEGVGSKKRRGKKKTVDLPSLPLSSQNLSNVNHSSSSSFPLPHPNNNNNNNNLSHLLNLSNASLSSTSAVSPSFNPLLLHHQQQQQQQQQQSGNTSSHLFEGGQWTYSNFGINNNPNGGSINQESAFTPSNNMFTPNWISSPNSNLERTPNAISNGNTNTNTFLQGTNLSPSGILTPNSIISNFWQDTNSFNPNTNSINPSTNSINPNTNSINPNTNSINPNPPNFPNPFFANSNLVNSSFGNTNDNNTSLDNAAAILVGSFFSPKNEFFQPPNFSLGTNTPPSKMGSTSDNNNKNKNNTHSSNKGLKSSQVFQTQTETFTNGGGATLIPPLPNKDNTNQDIPLSPLAEIASERAYLPSPTNKNFLPRKKEDPN